MKTLNEITIDELNELIKAQELDRPYLNFTDIVKSDMLRHVENLSKNWNYDINTQLLAQSYSPNPCGCLGPRNNYSVCPCSLNMNFSMYRYHIAKILKEKV